MLFDHVTVVNKTEPVEVWLVVVIDRAHFQYKNYDHLVTFLNTTTMSGWVLIIIIIIKLAILGHDY